MSRLKALVDHVRRGRIDTVAHPVDEPPQIAAVIFTGRIVRGATLGNMRGAPTIPDGWTVMGHGLNRDPHSYPRLLLEPGGKPVPRRNGPIEHPNQRTQK